ncbi:SDR family NAD(P)-dependent oxidoreductase [Peribacillus acanthi]|uniref:SDR family NAD(P)-dependent oxidoreductase n=1 Tax=Peribacillus acanthi TaxID=2171554 RepID=UPI000D3E976C|nr:SDR family oxidoreductase [Peribacillus acanthi]
MSKKFEGQIVVITGGSNGIGEGIAKGFAQKGATVCIADLDDVRGKEVQKEIEDEGGTATFFHMDVKIEEDVKRIIHQVDKQFGKIDILINNAGISKSIPFLDLTLEEWDDIIHTNLRSVFLVSREAAKIMPPGGRIINISSTRAEMSEPNSEAYAASKGGIVSLTHAIAASLQIKGITVNCISPGWIQTVGYEGLNKNDHLQHWSNRVGRPEDIAKACFYFSDPENDFINGQNIIVDGGMTRKMIYEE